MTAKREVPFQDLPAAFLKELKDWAAVGDTLHLILSRDRYVGGDGESGDEVIESVWWEAAPARAHLASLRTSASGFTELTHVPLKVRLSKDAVALAEDAGTYHLPLVLAHLVNGSLLQDLRRETGSVLSGTGDWQLACWHALDSNPDLDKELTIPEDPILERIDTKFRRRALFMISHFQHQLLRADSYFCTLKTQRCNAKQGWGRLEDLLKKHLNPEDLAAPVRLLPYLRKFIAANVRVVVYREDGKDFSVADCLKEYVDELERRPEAKALMEPGRVDHHDQNT